MPMDIERVLASLYDATLVVKDLQHEEILNECEEDREAMCNAVFTLWQTLKRGFTPRQKTPTGKWSAFGACL